MNSPDLETALVEGEQLNIAERVIVSTATGLYKALDDARRLNIGDDIEVGTIVATVGAHDITSQFAGLFMGELAIEGERVTPGQPIAWLRTRGGDNQ